MTATLKRPRRAISGVLLLDKPYGWSSNQALQKCKGLLQAEKAGHTGVLDPLATGLLPLCFGEATKFAQRMLDADKAYVATLRLGETRTTGDLEGEVLTRHPVTASVGDVQSVLARFRGTYAQTPPMYSALKHEGRPLYEYARAGIAVPRPAREVTIHALDLLRFEGDVLVIEVRCSKGTYVRTLAEDIGAALGCGAHLTALRRTATAGFSVADTLTVEALEGMALAARDGCLLPTDALLADLPAITLDADRTARLVRGMSVPFPENGAIIADLRLYGAEDAATPGFLGLGSLAHGRLKPCRLLSTVVAR